MSARESAGRFEIAQDSGFVEVADRCWVARHCLVDVNLGVVGGSRGLVVIDTHSSAATARVVLEQVRALGAGEVVAVVNTHAHWDHVLGNGTFVESYAGVPVVAHEDAAAALREHGDRLLEEAGRHTDVTGTRVVVPDQTFSSAKVVDLGDRFVEVVHLGRGHTAGDAVARVPDADVVFAGDLVEESAERAAVPGFGDDCYPLDWPATLDLLTGMVGQPSVVVPGHGLPVDREFVMDQRASIGVVAEMVRDLAGQGVRPEDMAGAGEWPYPVEELTHAFARGFAQLPRSSRSSLPLL
jgi:glyoxylase-like metal-dependent hydrolase (beta-lactamase superfamily II)